MAGPQVVFPPRPEGYTVDDASALPGRVQLIDGSLWMDVNSTVAEALESHPDCRYIEVVDGNVVVNPVPDTTHANAVHFVMRWIEDRLDAAAWKVRQNINVYIGDRSMLIPDITVYRADAKVDRPWIDPNAVALVVELRSPGEPARRMADRAARYLDAGVGAVWSFDLADKTHYASGRCEAITADELAQAMASM